MKLAYILSNPYSGSTLTDICLGLIKGSVSMGEVVRLAMTESERVYSFGNRCQCKKTIDLCEEWRARKSGVFGILDMPQSEDWSCLRIYPRERTLPFYARPVSNLINLVWLKQGWSLSDPLSIFARRSWTFLDALAEVKGASLLVDSSKTQARFLNLYRQRPDQTILVLLVRDPRGIFNSTLRKLPAERRGNKNLVEKIAKRIAKSQTSMKRIYSMLPSDAKFLIRYEDLCCDAESVLISFAARFGLDETVRFEDVAKIAYHGMPGSIHTVVKQEGLKLDERWRSGLSPYELKLIENLSADYMESFEYERETTLD